MTATFFITGISSGIGAATAEIALSDGHSIIGVDVQEPTSTVARHSKNFVFYKGCVTDHVFIGQAIRSGGETQGPVTRFFNNAGILGSKHKLTDLDLGLWEKLVSTNLTGTLVCLSEQLKYAQTTGQVAIVNNASISGQYGSADYPLYSAVKHGIIGLTKSIAKQYSGAKLRCNAICPSAVLSPMTKRELDENNLNQSQEENKHPVGRFATVEEVARTALWLLSSDASYINGQAILIDGGLFL